MSEIASILSNTTDTGNLRLLASKGNEEANSEILQQFEALFLQQMLKSMRTASLGEGLFSSEQTEFYRDMYDQHIAADLAEKEVLGISQLINKQLGVNTISGIDSKDDKQISQVQKDIINSVGAPENVNTKESEDNRLPAVSRLVEELSLEVANVSGQSGESIKPVRPLAFKPQSPDEFVSVAHQYAQTAAKRLGVDADALVAIAALETGWGNHLPQDENGSSNNYFGIKADGRWQGESVGSKTLEFESGTFKELTQNFRAYDSLKESFNDFAEFILGNERYSSALEFAHDTKRFVREIQNAGYATDPKYAEKIMNVLDNKAFLGIRK